MEIKSPYEIADGIYWVGSATKYGSLNCNPYLIVDNGEGVLIDPGSVLDFDEVFASVTSLIPLNRIHHIILQHQDPDFCSAVPALEANGFTGEIATFWRTAIIVKFYGIRSPFYLINEHGFELIMRSGRKLHFFLTPYLHFPGAIVTYDQQTKTLFSSDLFGGFSFKNAFSLYADDDYMDAMLEFHEHYMPGNDIIRPVMEMLLTIDIKLIAPQHGSIIDKKVTTYIKALRDLECGLFLDPVRKSLKDSGGYASIANIFLKRCKAVFPLKDVLSVFDKSAITIDSDSVTIIDYNCLPEKLIDTFFQLLYEHKGYGWLNALEIIVKKLCTQYAIPIPEIYQSTIMQLQQTTQMLSSENARLEEINRDLNRSVLESQNQLEHCPVTGLYNRVFFEQYLQNIQKNNQTTQGALILIKIDRMQFINYTYGNAAGNETLKNIAYLLKEIITDISVTFKLDGALFACHCPEFSKHKAVDMAEKIRITVSKSNIFIEPVTVTISIAAFEELAGKESLYADRAQWLFAIAEMRLHHGTENGHNLVISESSLSIERYSEGLVLIADSEPLNLDTLRKKLTEYNIDVITCSDGEQALTTIEQKSPDIIVSEIMLPKIDGFMVREKMLTTTTKKMPLFIITSYVKTDQTLHQAHSLNIVHYLKKPYFLTELTGIILNHLKYTDTL